MQQFCLSSIFYFLSSLALSEIDFMMSEGELVFSNVDHVNSCQFINIGLVDDLRLEMNEMFSVELFGTQDSSVVTLTQTMTNVIIIDNDRKCFCLA